MYRRSLAALCLIATLANSIVHAEKRYGPGVTDTEILLGQTMPYSGPASVYGTYGLAQLAFFRMLNEHGGVNGRKIKLLSLDDGFSPPRAVEQIRKLVEQEQVLAIFSSFGTPTNTAIVKYLNLKKVPHLFVTSGAAEFADPKTYPWTMGWRVNYVSEGKAYARYLLQARPNARIAILYQHDDVGKDYIRGLRDGLGERADKMIVADASFEVTDPTVDSQIVTLKASGADTLFIFSSAKPAAQAIRKVWDVDWHPLHGDEAGWTRKVGWRHQRRVPEGSDRQSLAERFRPQRMARLHEAVLSGGRSDRPLQCLRVRYGADFGAGAQAVR